MLSTRYDAIEHIADYLTYQIIKFYRCDPLVDTRYDFLSDGSSIDVFWIESITEAGDASCDLVELNALLASIYITIRKCQYGLG